MIRKPEKAPISCAADRNVPSPTSVLELMVYSVFFGTKNAVVQHCPRGHSWRTVEVEKRSALISEEEMNSTKHHFEFNPLALDRDNGASDIYGCWARQERRRQGNLNGWCHTSRHPECGGCLLLLSLTAVPVESTRHAVSLPSSEIHGLPLLSCTSIPRANNNGDSHPVRLKIKLPQTENLSACKGLHDGRGSWDADHQQGYLSWEHR